MRRANDEYNFLSNPSDLSEPSNPSDLSESSDLSEPSEPSDPSSQSPQTSQSPQSPQRPSESSSPQSPQSPQSKKSIAQTTQQKPVSQQSAHVDYYIKGLTGEFKDLVFKLTSREIFIGREKNNHIRVIEDLRVSRKQARFIQSQGKLYIQNLSQNNSIKVNNETVDKTELRSGYVVTIGQMNLKVIADTRNTQTSLEDFPPPKEAKKAKKKLNPIVAGALILIVSTGVYIHMVSNQQPQAKKTLREIATQESVSHRLNEETKALEEIKIEISSSQKANPDYIESQKIYMKGFRNFQKGMYAQAVSSFETSLSLYPDHHLARRYKVLSENRLDELIDFHITEGRIHLENEKYNFCIAAFKNAMFQSYDKNDKRFAEAKIGHRKCEILKRNQY